MPVSTILKIDLVGSKTFASLNENVNPEIRKQAFAKLLQISGNQFPDADKPYPGGSFYKGDGDALYYILSKASVALRGSIEFMQNWYQVAVPEYPGFRLELVRDIWNTPQSSPVYLFHQTSIVQVRFGSTLWWLDSKRS